jgi:hypothetical protein
MSNEEELYRKGCAAAERRAVETKERPSYEEWLDVMEEAGLTAVLDVQADPFVIGFTETWDRLVPGTTPFDPSMN